MNSSQKRLLACAIAILFSSHFALAIEDEPKKFGESMWIEAEHFDGIRGYCWPMGTPQMRETKGNWGLSGPGWAAEWNQGGESGFLSIAAGPNDAQATVSKSIELPCDGTYFVWVRYGDWREQSEPFEVYMQQAGRTDWTATFGQQPQVEEDNEMKLYFDWAFAWDRQSVELKKGSARIELRARSAATNPRQVDVVVLTTDPNYQPRIKHRPSHPIWSLLDTYRRNGFDGEKPLTRRVLVPEGNMQANLLQVPDTWQSKTFANKGFLYLWNTSATGLGSDWLGDDPQRILYPNNLRDADANEEFRKKYGGQANVPIYSDPRIVPTFHGVGPGIFATEGPNGPVKPPGQQFARWLDQHPDRMWAMMMNYHPGEVIGEEGIKMFNRYRDRYIGSISGESLGYFYPADDKMRAATESATTRRQLVEGFTPLTLASNTEKYQAIFGRQLDANPYQDVIACKSVGNIAFAPLCATWGARTIGYESAAATSVVLPMRWAFMRGAARQFDNLTATYRSCNFGDSSTIFSNTQSYHSPQNILDNYYSVFSGAGMTWYKMDIWYQYMAGSSMFYHEQGFDEFWKPGGTTAAGIKEIQLSPKGKLVDRFLRHTAAEPDRGHPFTPVAFLVDYAHGWEPAPFWPNAFGNWHQHEDRFLHSPHERMLEEYFWTAYYPIGPESEKPITGTNEVFVPGIFGDMFDVIFALPDTNRWRTIDTYPAVIVAGDIELSAGEGQRLATYVENGGTLVVARGQLTGPGLEFLKLPKCESETESQSYRWQDGPTVYPSQRFRCGVIPSTDGWVPVAANEEGKLFCAQQDRGKGRLIYLAVDRGLGIDGRAIPVVAKLMAGLTRNMMPVEVKGDVEWLLNRSTDGWLVTILNPAGQDKPQQGITPTDYSQNKPVQIRCSFPIRSARDRLMPNDAMQIHGSTIDCEAPAGGVRIVEIKG
jgi:hypothetical protein